MPTDHSEAAFPSYSRAASAATYYNEATRRDVVRLAGELFHIPCGAEADAGHPIVHWPMLPLAADEEGGASAARGRRSRLMRSQEPGAVARR